MVDVNPAHQQLLNRMEMNNPKKQAYFFEHGNVYRVRITEKDGTQGTKNMDECLEYQSLCYMHIPKRNLSVLDDDLGDSFWITPIGFAKKMHLGWPSKGEVQIFNHFPGEEVLHKEKKQYKNRKVFEIARRTPYQIYVRFKQQCMGIGAAFEKGKGMTWNECHPENDR